MNLLHGKTAKGVAAVSLAMLMALPALTGCAGHKQATGAVQDTTQSAATSETQGKTGATARKKAAVKQSGGTASGKRAKKAAGKTKTAAGKGEKAKTAAPDKAKDGKTAAAAGAAQK